MLETKRRLFWIIVSLSFFPGARTFAQNSPTSPEVSISLEKDTITEHEPVIVDIGIQSPPSTSLDFDPGYDWENVEIKVADPHGHIWTRPRRVPQEGMKFSKAVHVDAGARETISLVASDWFNLEEDGIYQLEVALRGSLAAGVTAILALRVEPRNEEALKATCSSLLSRVNDSQSFSASLVAAKALSGINDPLAVPYLAEAMKRREFVALVIGALARLNTQEAVDALIAASRSPDPETSSQARSALASLRHPN